MRARPPCCSMTSTGPGTPSGRAEPTKRFATGTKMSGSSTSSTATAVLQRLLVAVHDDRARRVRKSLSSRPGRKVLAARRLAEQRQVLGRKVDHIVAPGTGQNGVEHLRLALRHGEVDERRAPGKKARSAASGWPRSKQKGSRPSISRKSTSTRASSVLPFRAWSEQTMKTVGGAAMAVHCSECEFRQLPEILT